MTTPHDEDKLREIADYRPHSIRRSPPQLYEDADYLAQLRKAPGDVNEENEVRDDA
jgi:hypothetical protein